MYKYKKIMYNMHKMLVFWLINKKLKFIKKKLKNVLTTLKFYDIIKVS